MCYSSSVRVFIFSCCICSAFCFFFFFNDTATTEIYTLSLHDALPISVDHERCSFELVLRPVTKVVGLDAPRDRKSTRLNSSHLVISYAVFCLKKKNKKEKHLMSSPLCSK